MQHESVPGKRAMTIGYQAPQFKGAQSILKLGPAFRALADEYRIKARESKPEWYEKYACIYFMYEGKPYLIGPGTLDTDDHHFACIERELIRDLYRLGAYEMFYAGMMD